MAIVDLTLGLEGDPPPEVYVRAAQCLDELASALAAEQSSADALAWHMSGAGTGRGAVSIAGEGASDELAAGMAHRFLAVGRTLAGGEAAECPPPVRRIASAVARLLDDGAAALRFETASGTEWAPRPMPEPREAPGCVTGWLAAQAAPVGVRFALLDEISGQSVSCYLDQPDQHLHEALRDRRTAVHGLITYQANGKCAAAVRAITKIELDLSAQDDAWGQSMQIGAGTPAGPGSVTWFLEERERARERFWRER